MSREGKTDQRWENTTKNLQQMISSVFTLLAIASFDVWAEERAIIGHRQKRPSLLVTTGVLPGKEAAGSTAAAVAQAEGALADVLLQTGP